MSDHNHRPSLCIAAMFMLEVKHFILGVMEGGTEIMVSQFN